MRKAKKIEMNAENYDFQIAMKQNVREKIEPLLYENKFKKSTQRKYVREMDGLIQEICIGVGKHRIRAFALYIPVFLPFDSILEYGIEISSYEASKLLGGEYFKHSYLVDITEDEFHDNRKVLFQHYENELIGRLNDLTYVLKEGILYEMNHKVNSLDNFMNVFWENKEFLGDHSWKTGTELSTHKYIVAVYECLKGEFEEGVIQLKKLRSRIEEDSRNTEDDNEIEEDIKEYINRLLKEEDGKLDKEQLLINYEEICNERRKKYKLLKK